MSLELSGEPVFAMCRVLLDHDVGYVDIVRHRPRLRDTGLATIDIDICVHPPMGRTSRGLRPHCETLERGFASKASRLASYSAHPDMFRQVEMLTLITDHVPLDLGFLLASPTAG